jgi:Domain of unknown function (DUF1857)
VGQCNSSKEASMIHSTATLPVNPAGVPPLTREQIWKGLELKARDALFFNVLTLAKPKRRLKGTFAMGSKVMISATSSSRVVASRTI